MCVHSSLNQIYWSDIEHGVSSVDECTQVCYFPHYLNVVSHITMSDLMMDVHKYATDNTTYTMLCQISISDLMMNEHTWI
jgi:hypothetical protein